MNYPQELTQSDANALASPQDIHAMRVIVRRVANQAVYRLSGKRRRYVLPYCKTMNVHFIDIPFSVWLDTIDPARPYEDNFSVAHDIQHNSPHAESLVVFPVPYGPPRDVQDAVPPADTAATPAPAVAPEVMFSLRSLCQRFGAPEIILDALDLVARGLPKKATCLALDNTVPGDDAAPDLNPLPFTTAAAATTDKMRKMREAKAAKKAPEPAACPA